MTEDISEFTNDQDSTYLFYSSGGQTAKEKTNKDCAYAITSNGKETYYAKFLRGSLFDPQGIDGGKINALGTSYKKVEKKTFDFYIDYLKTKKRNSLTWAERSNIDV
tara:strand:+ start:22 stop:342 length:321 start_codon:yes stop_codon:yes gene_type:complete